MSYTDMDDSVDRFVETGSFALTWISFIQIWKMKHPKHGGQHANFIYAKGARTKLVPLFSAT